MEYLKSVCERMKCSIGASSSAVELIHHAMMVYRSGEIDEHLPARPPIENWERMYRGGPDLLRGVADGDESLLGMNGEEAVQTLRSLGQISWMARSKSEDLRVVFQEIFEEQETIRQFIRGLRLGPRAHSIYLARIARELRERESLAAEDLNDDFISSPEMLFYIRVQLPCMMQYRMVPRVVIFKATRDKSELVRTQNIEILCRLDPWAHDLPVVSRWLNHPAGPVRRERMRRFCYLREQGIDDGQFSMRRVKQCIGGFVHLMIRQTGTWLDTSVRPWKWTPPKLDRGLILQLFHAVEKERTGNPNAKDPDLCDIQPRSFYKQMDRASCDWKPLLINGRGTKVA